MALHMTPPGWGSGGDAVGGDGNPTVMGGHGSQHPGQLLGQPVGPVFPVCASPSSLLCHPLPLSPSLLAKEHGLQQQTDPEIETQSTSCLCHLRDVTVFVE